MKYFLTYIDILGFEDIPKDIAKKFNLTPEEVRNTYKDRVGMRLKNIKEKGYILDFREISLDSWLLFTDNYCKVIESIGEVLKAELLFEIAIGVKEFHYSPANQALITLRDETISFLKDDIISSYRLNIKKQGKRVNETFILLTEEAHDQFYSNKICFEDCIISKKGMPFYVVEQEKFKALYDEIINIPKPTESHKKSNFNQDVEKYLNLIKNKDFFRYTSKLYTELSALEIPLLPITVRSSKQNASRREECEISELIKNEVKVILYGDVGSGKTITLQWLTYQYAEQWIPDYENQYLPFYIDLTNYNRGSFEEYVRRRVKEYKIGDMIFTDLLEHYSLIFFIDGLDLVAIKKDFDPYSEIMNFISDHSQNRAGKAHKYVISSRPSFFEPFRSSVGFTLAKLMELSDTDIHNFLEKYVDQSDLFTRLQNQIITSDELRSFCRNPLILSLIIMVELQRSRETTIEPIPLNKAKLYKEVIAGIFRHRTIKPQVLPDDYSQLIEKVLVDFNFTLQSRNEVTSSYEFALGIVEKHAGDPLHKEKRFSNILDEIKSIGLISIYNEEVTYGIHQSFQEYFAAIRLVELYKKGKNISPVFSHPRWENVILFAAGMVDTRDQFVSAIYDKGEIHLAAKCALYVSDPIKEKISERLASLLKSRFTSDIKQALDSLGRLGDIGVEHIAKSLMINDLDVVFSAAEALSKIKSERAVELLFLMLALGPDEHLAAFNALCETKSERAVELLIPCLKVKYPDIRREAAFILSKMESEQAVESLILLLKDPYVQDYAIDALLRINSERAFNLLIPLLKNKKNDVRKAAIEALGEIKFERAVELLLPLLQDKNIDIRRTAIDSLGKIKSERAVVPLILLLKDKNSEIRNYAAESLGKIKSERAVEPLILLLKDEDSGVRRSAAEALGEIKSEQAVEPLITLLKDEDSDVRDHAAESLGKIKSEQAMEPLITLLKDEDSGVRDHAAFVLRKITSERTVDRIIQLLKDNDSNVRKAAVKALGNIKSERVTEHLISMLKDEDSNVRRSAAEALSEIKSEHAVEPLITLLKDEDSNVRLSAALALGEIKSEQAVEHIIPLLEDGDILVKIFAAHALSEIKSEQAVEPLIQLLNDGNLDVRQQAVESLGLLKSELAVEPLILRLDDISSTIRESAADALGEIKSERAVEPLIPLLKDRDEEVREAAAEALSKTATFNESKTLEKLVASRNSFIANTGYEILIKIRRNEAASIVLELDDLNN